MNDQVKIEAIAKGLYEAHALYEAERSFENVKREYGEAGVKRMLPADPQTLAGWHPWETLGSGQDYWKMLARVAAEKS